MHVCMMWFIKQKWTWHSKKYTWSAAQPFQLGTKNHSQHSYEKVSKPVFRPCTFLFPYTENLPSIHWKKSAHNKTNKTKIPIFVTYWKSNTTQNKFSFWSPMSSIIVIIFRIFFLDFIYNKFVLFSKFSFQILKINKNVNFLEIGEELLTIFSENRFIPTSYVVFKRCNLACC